MPMPARVTRRSLRTLFALLLTALAVPAAAAAAPTPAVQVHLLWSGVDGAEMDRQLDKAAGAGAGMIRADLGWSSLEEKGKGQYSEWYLRKADMLVEKAQARGLKVLLTVTHTPCWASSAPDSVKQGCSAGWWDRNVERWAPTAASDYADAMVFLVRRYGARVAAWELWNEPNASHFFKASDPARQYAELVKAAYPAIKAADPSAQVIAGSLMESDWEFTEALYSHGIKGHFDGFSFHPYSGDRSPLAPEVDRYREHSFHLGVPAIRAVLARHGDAKPLWLTEFGWSTAPIRGGETWENGVDADVQARYIEQAYAHMATWNDVAAGVYFNLSDTSNGSSELVNNFGLLRLDGSEKPGYAAFKRAAAALASGAPAGTGTGTETAPAPAPAPTLSAFSVRRTATGVRARATLSGPGRLRLLAYRYDRSLGRYERTPSYAKVIEYRRGGTIARDIVRSRFTSGTWRFVAQAHGATRRVTIGAAARQAAARRGSRRKISRRTNSRSLGLRKRSQATRTRA